MELSAGPPTTSSIAFAALHTDTCQKAEAARNLAAELKEDTVADAPAAAGAGGPEVRIPFFIPPPKHDSSRICFVSLARPPCVFPRAPSVQLSPRGQVSVFGVVRLSFSSAPYKRRLQVSVLQGMLHQHNAVLDKIQRDVRGPGNPLEGFSTAVSQH